MVMSNYRRSERRHPDAAPGSAEGREADVPTRRWEGSRSRESPAGSAPPGGTRPASLQAPLRLLSLRQEGEAGLRQRNLPGRSGQELHAEIPFHLADAMTESRLGQVQVRCGMPKAAALCDGDECRQTRKIDAHCTLRGESCRGRGLNLTGCMRIIYECAKINDLLQVPFAGVLMR